MSLKFFEFQEKFMIGVNLKKMPNSRKMNHWVNFFYVGKSEH